MDSLLAYPVPFRLQRDVSRNLYTLTNISTETIDGVTFTLHGAGVMSVSHPAVLAPGDVIEAIVVGRNLARQTILVVRWFRPNGVEYLWRISF